MFFYKQKKRVISYKNHPLLNSVSLLSYFSLINKVSSAFLRSAHVL